MFYYRHWFDWCLGHKVVLLIFKFCQRLSNVLTLLTLCQVMPACQAQSDTPALAWGISTALCIHIVLMCASYTAERKLPFPIDGLVQDCSNSNVVTMELMQSCTEPSVCKSWWRHHMDTFSALRAICVGNSPIHKGQWRRALMFSLICVWINGWVNSGGAGDLRCYRAHYDFIVMSFTFHAVLAEWLFCLCECTSTICLLAPFTLGRPVFLGISGWWIWYEVCTEGAKNICEEQIFQEQRQLQWLMGRNPFFLCLTLQWHHIACFKSLATGPVCSTACSDQQQRNHHISALLSLCVGNPAVGQWCRKHFHAITSFWPVREDITYITNWFICIVIILVSQRRCYVYC